MSEQIPIVEAFRVMTANKSLSEEELHDLIRDGIHAALARRFDGPVDAEIEVQADGDIRIVVLKEVVEVVEDPAREIRLEEARWDDADFQVGDLMEIPVDFRDFGRGAVMAAKQRIIQRVREGERDKIREEFNDRVGELVSARSSRSSVARWSSCSTGRVRPRRSSRGGSRTRASASVRASRFAPCSRNWRKLREARV